MILSNDLNLSRKGVVPTLICVQGIVLFPLWYELPMWVGLITAALMAMKYLSYKLKFNYPSFLVLALVLISLICVYFHFRTISGRDAGVSLICLMYSFKLLESKSYRDAAIILFISFFIMVMAFLFNHSILMGFYLLISMTAILSGIVIINSIGGISRLKKITKISGATLLQALPIMIALFFIFPRLPGPLWGWKDSRAGTGISDSMSPGSISSLTDNDDPAFRVKFMGDAPSAEQMYWRGITLSVFDGFIWSVSKSNTLISKSSISNRPIVYTYQVNLEPNFQHWLFGLENLGAPSKNVQLLNDSTWRRRVKNAAPYSYKGTTISGNYEQNINVAAYTDLPVSGNSLTKKWAKDLYRRSEDVSRFIQLTLKHINESEFYYTRAPEVLINNVIDEFWLGTKEGFCEHYASAFTFIMRAAGVPARVVGGYQGGEYNPYGDFYLVKQSDAHAWTEVWIEGQGWVRVDPTAAIHPDRIEENYRIRASRRDSWFSDKEFGFALPTSFLEKIVMRWDAVKSFWDDSLMGYGQEQQYDWLSKLGIKSEQWRYLGYALITILILSGLVFGLWLLRHSAKKDPVERYYDLLKQKLIKNGVEIPAHFGPQALSDLLEKNHPKIYVKYKTPLQFYIAIRYKKSDDDDFWLERFKAQVKAL